mgnify:CR=1 FL=1
MSKQAVIVFLGPPGSGKGTQAELLASKFGFKHIATGDIFRWHMRNMTELGRRIKDYLERGELVPDSITISVVKDALTRNRSPIGYIFDGFPRTINQARELDKLLHELGLKVSIVIYLNVSKREAVRRLLERGRHDDKPETIERRFDEYRDKTEPIRKYYERQGVLVVIDGERSIQDVHASIISLLRDRGILD